MRIAEVAFRELPQTQMTHPRLIFLAELRLQIIVQ